MSKISFYMHILTFFTHGLWYYCRVIFALLLFVAQRSPVAQHLAGRDVMVVFVFRYQTCRIRVRHHQIVFIAEATFDTAVLRTVFRYRQRGETQRQRAVQRGDINRYICRLGFPAEDGCRHIVLKFLLRKQR